MGTSKCRITTSNAHISNEHQEMEGTTDETKATTSVMVGVHFQNCQTDILKLDFRSIRTRNGFWSKKNWTSELQIWFAHTVHIPSKFSNSNPSRKTACSSCATYPIIHDEHRNARNTVIKAHANANVQV